MKNCSSIFALLLLSYLPLTSQTTYGIKAGINASTVYSNKFAMLPDGDHSRAKADIVPRFQGGLWANFLINERFSVQPEFLYLSRTWILADSESPRPLYFDYLSLPVLINYRLGRWQIEGGPAINYLLEQYYEKRGSSVERSSFVDKHVVELALNAGFRYHFQRGSLGLRYQIDYTPFLSFQISDANGNPIPSSEIRFYHQGLQLSLGYSLIKEH